MIKLSLFHMCLNMYSLMANKFGLISFLLTSGGNDTATHNW